MTPIPFAHVLVGYLPTEQGADARALGVDLAAACGADLLLVSIVAAVWIEHLGEQTGPAVVHSGERERAASALKDATAELAGVPGIGHVERRLEASSSPARGLHDTAVAEQVDLIVVGSSHHGPLGRVLLGSVGERLLAGAPCAVAIAPRGHAAREPRGIGVVAVAFDGSPEAQVALRTAHDLATRSGAPLRALMVIEPPASIPGQFVPLPGLEPLVTIERGEALQRQELAARSALDSAVHGLGGGAAIEQEVLFGSDPASSILGAAGTDVDLLMLGSRAYGPVRRALLGSVSAAVVRHAPCSVLMMPRVDESAGREQHAGVIKTG
jgi:nucleotide-binding universal stress UspA family protein